MMILEDRNDNVQRYAVLLEMIFTNTHLRMRISRLLYHNTKLPTVLGHHIERVIYGLSE